MRNLLAFLLVNNEDSIEAINEFIDKNHDYDLYKKEVSQARILLEKFKRIGNDLNELYETNREIEEL